MRTQKTRRIAQGVALPAVAARRATGCGKAEARDGDDGEPTLRRQGARNEAELHGTSR
jgi:hypothetical protein